MSPNSSNYIRTRIHWVWEQFSLRRDDFGREYVVAYPSRSNNTAKANYSSYEGEALAAMWAIAHIWPYLYGECFTLVTDHQPLRWLMHSDKLTGKLAKWALLL